MVLEGETVHKYREREGKWDWRERQCKSTGRDREGKWE